MDAGPGRPGSDGAESPDGRPRTALQDAWRRHTAVATAAEPDLPLGSRTVRALRPLPRTMVGATAALVALTVALTGLAGPLYGLADRAATDLLDRTPYLTSVFGTEEIR
jgi:multicomponent Na+:H+ antiporter subunit D